MPTRRAETTFVYALQNPLRRGFSAIMLQRIGEVGRRITDPPGEGVPGDWSPDLSSDGTLLAYVRTVRLRKGRPVHASVRLLDRRTGKTETVLRRAGDDIGDVAWAPDNRHLAINLGRGQRRGYYALDVRNGDLRPLLLGHRLSSPGWSADGHTFIACNGSVVELDLRTGTVHTVGPSDIQDPALSPDGRLIAYQTTRDENGSTSDGSDSTRTTSELHVMQADGSHDVRITYTSGIDEAQPAWLNDSTLLYIRDVVLTRLDFRTLHTQRLTHDNGYDGDVATRH